MTPGRRAGLAVAVLAVAAAPLAAQATRALDASRPLLGETRIQAALNIQGGAVRVAAAPSTRLYRVEVQYPPEQVQPDVVWAPASARLAIDVAGKPGWRMPLRPPAAFMHRTAVGVSTAVDLALAATLSAAEAEFDLEGVRVASVRLEAEGSRTVVRFGAANRGPCREARFEVSTGDLTLERFGASGCRALAVAGRLGRIVVDLSGTPAGGSPGVMQGTLSATVADLVLRVPRDVGVRLVTERTLSRVRAPGLRPVDDALESEGYGSAARRVDLRVTARLASVTLEWVEP